MRRPGQPHVLPNVGSSRPAGDVTSGADFAPQYTANVVMPLQRADRRARQTAITSRSVILEAPGGSSEVLRKDTCVPAESIRERWQRPGWPRGVLNPLPHPRGRSDRTTGQASC